MYTMIHGLKGWPEEWSESGGTDKLDIAHYAIVQVSLEMKSKIFVSVKCESQVIFSGPLLLTI